MVVATMAWMDALSWLLYLVLVILVFFSSYVLSFGYLVSVILFLQYMLLIWMIPLNLNWSRNSYSRLLWKLALFFCVTVLSFSFVYRFYGVIDTVSGATTKNLLTSLYFSITTWTTLGYGDFRPVPAIRLLASFEAVIGILSMPLMFAMIWKYCDFRFRTTSEEDEKKARNGFRVYADERGVWKELDENDQIIDIEQSYDLNPCCKCGNTNLKVERYFLLGGGFLSPKMQFMVHCTCGHFVHGKYMAMSAVRGWNKKNKKG